MPELAELRGFHTRMYCLLVPVLQTHNIPNLRSEIQV